MIKSLARRIRVLCIAALALSLVAAPAAAMELLSLTITTALTAQVGSTFQYRGLAGREIGPPHVILQCSFTYGSGGTSADAWIQTSIDGGTTWIDVVNCHYTTASAKSVANLNGQTAVATLYTPTDGALSANTSKDGIVGPLWRVKYTTVGTYAGGTTLIVSIFPMTAQ